MAVEAPLMIDMTDPDVAEAALQLYPGRGIINGNNLENGRERIDRSSAHCPQARRGACCRMTIDEEGMAKTARRKARSRARASATSP